jgi:hypothetical protein
MLLRSLAENLKAQSWAAASIELLVVTVGVFIGIQVSNWNENRLINDRASVLTERLLSDLRLETRSIMRVYLYHGDVLANAERVLQALTGEKEASKSDLLIFAYRATQYSLTTDRRSNYEELVATGGISLITDKRLQKVATDYFNSQMFDFVRESGVESRYRSLLRETMPVAVHRKIRLACGDDARGRNFDFDHVQPGDMMDFECSPDLTQVEIDAAVASLRANDSIVPALRLRIAIMDGELADIKATFIDGEWQRFHDDWAEGGAAAQTARE